MERQLLILGLAILGFALAFLLVYLLRPREKFPYEARELLTDNERNFYEILAPICREHDWGLLMKVRLADLVAVKPDSGDYMGYFNKIRSKHTDFVLIDLDTLEFLCGIELDDASHEREDREERDDFVDAVYAVCGLNLIHVYMPITANELELLLLEEIEGF